MANIEPITGRYVRVPYEGEEYRVFYEEAGQGVPLVCLHTAGTDTREWRHQLCDAAYQQRLSSHCARPAATRKIPSAHGLVERRV